MLLILEQQYLICYYASFDVPNLTLQCTAVYVAFTHITLANGNTKRERNLFTNKQRNGQMTDSATKECH